MDLVPAGKRPLSNLPDDDTRRRGNEEGRGNGPQLDIESANQLDLILSIHDNHEP